MLDVGRRSTVAIVLLALAAALAVVAQSSSPAPQQSSMPAERVEVRLAQFDVVVRDADGRIATGLTPSDFEVLEAGSPLEVVAVDEWGAAAPAKPAAPSPAPSPSSERPPGAVAAGTPPPAASPEPASPASPLEQRSIVLLFDGLNTTSALKFNQAKRAAIGFVGRDLRANDITAVYQLDLALRPQCGFTTDVSEITQAIKGLTWMPSSSLSDQIAENVLAYRSRGGVDYVQPRLERGAFLSNETLEWQRDHTYALLTTVAEVFDGLPGRRILVYLSGGFPMTTPGDIERDQGGFTAKFRGLIRALGASGVSVYSVDVGDDLTIGDVSRPIDWRIAVGKLGLDESILTDIGLDAQLSSGSASARRQSLGVLAAETGGRLLTHSDLSKAFDVIQEESTSFYRVSCRVSKSHEATRYRKVSIRIRRPGYKVTARKGRYGDTVPGGSLDARTVSLAESSSAFRAILLTAATTTLPFAAANGRVPVVLVVEALGPLDYPSDGQGGAKLDLDFFLNARAGGEIVGRYSRTVSGAMRAGGADAVRKAFRLEGRLDLAPGSYDVQAIVRINDPPQLGTWKAQLVVPAMPAGAGALEITGLMLSPPAAEASPLLARVESPPGTVDPLQFGEGVRLLPATRATYPAPGELVALFWLRGLALTETGAPKVDVHVVVQGTDGVVRETPSRLLAFVPRPDGGHAGLVGLDLAPLPAGAYVLRLQVDQRAPEPATAHAASTFRVVRADTPPVS